MNGNPIRVLIADDHDVVRRGLVVFLKTFPDLMLVGEAKNGIEAVHLAAELHPDVVIMDISMPEMDGIAATRAILAAQPEIKIVTLTSFKDDDLVRQSLQAGAVGYLLKDASVEELVQVVRTAVTGRITLSPHAARALLNGTSKPTKAQYHLTERELEVLGLLVRGMNNPAISEQLVVSRSTVKFHVSSILAKLGVSSRAEAVAVAVENHLVH